MKQYGFILIEELKKIYKNKFIIIYGCILVLNIIGICSEFYDRVHSTYYGEIGVHIRGQALEFLTKYEFGYSGQFLFYLLPVLFIAAPVFADEYSNGMYKNIRVSKNGRIFTTIAKINAVILCQILWCILVTMLTSLVSYILLDTGIGVFAEDIGIIFTYMINTLLGMFFVSELFLLISSVVKNNIVALGVGFAVLLVQVLVEVKSIYRHLIPVIGMAACSLSERTVGETFMVWVFYIMGGIIINVLIVRANR